MGGGFDEDADEVADHVVEEAVAGDAVDEEVFLLVPGGVVDGAGEAGSRASGIGSRERICVRSLFFAGGLVGVAGGEGGEVVGAEDVGRGLLERGEVEGETAGPDVGGQKGRADSCVVAAGEDAVLVGFAQGAVAGVEGFGDGFDGEDADACGERVVEGAMEIGGGDGDGEGEGGDLRESVDAGVGAAGALGENGFAGDAVDGVCEGALYGGEIGLDLPAVVGGSVVGEDELPVGHG